MRAAGTRGAAVAGVALALLVGCSNGEQDPSAGALRSPGGAAAPQASSTPAAGAVTSPTAPSATPGASTAPSAVTTPRPQAVPTLVERPGAPPPAQRLAAPAVAFDQPAAYPDGLSVRVRSTTSSVTTATGAGATADQPITTLVLEVSNSTSAPVDLTGVVVTAAYGPDASPADPVYGGQEQDVTGVLAIGSRAEGTYSFAIPPQARRDVTLRMDLDGRHLPAVWRGAVS